MVAKKCRPSPSTTTCSQGSPAAMNDRTSSGVGSDIRPRPRRAAPQGLPPRSGTEPAPPVRRLPPLGGEPGREQSGGGFPPGERLAASGQRALQGQRPSGSAGAPLREVLLVLD